MTKVNELKKHLKPGLVYRRSDLVQWSNAVDRHLLALLKDGTLKKLRTGMYYVPSESVFGKMPPDDTILIRNFLKDDYFLITSPNDFNSLGVGTTQLYNKRVVYNHKRHGEFKIGGKIFTFQVKYRFPKKATTEFLFVDLINNLDKIAEDAELISNSVFEKVKTMDIKKLKRAIREYGSSRTIAMINPLIKLFELKNDS